MRLILAPMEADAAFVAATLFAMLLFTLELLLSCFASAGYFNSFFFWLDLVSTASIITDIDPIMNALLGYGHGADDAEQQGAEAASTVSVARASRGARIGTKAGRMTRVIRLIRLIRIVKLYKSANLAQQRREQEVKDKDLAKKFEDAF